MKTRLRTGIVTALVVGVAALAPAASGADYEPFVTDFPKGVQPVEPYEPFATDFGKASLGDVTPTTTRVAPPALTPQAAPQGGIDWPSLGIGIAAGLALAGLAGGVVAVGRRHRRAAVA